jgi:hypothetical protein
VAQCIWVNGLRYTLRRWSHGWRAAIVFYSLLTFHDPTVEMYCIASRPHGCSPRATAMGLAAKQKHAESGHEHPTCLKIITSGTVAASV